MWFPTISKLDATLANLLERLSVVHSKMEAIISESQIFDSILGPSLEYQQFQSGGEKISQALISTRRLRGSGRLSVSDVNTKATNAAIMVERHEILFRAMIAARGKGAKAADRYFETKNA